MRAIAAFAFVVLLAFPSIASAGLCTITAEVFTGLCALNGGANSCLLTSAALNTGITTCAAGDIIQLAPASGTTTINVNAALNFGFNIQASATANVYINVTSAVTVAYAIALAATGTAVATLEIAKGVTVSMNAQLTIAVGATLKVAGTLNMAADMWVNGTINMAGDLTARVAAQTAVITSSSYNLYLGAGAATNVNGNGQIVMNTFVQGNVYINSNANSNSSANNNYIWIYDDVEIAANAYLKVGSNVTFYTTAVYGCLHLAGSTTASTTVHFDATSTIQVGDSTKGQYAQFIGNGAVDGSVSLYANASISAGNSPGYMWISGSLSLGPTSVMIVDVASSSDYDKYVISNSFSRAGVLYINFINNVNIATNTVFTYATHASASGSFSAKHGNNAATFNKVYTNETSTTSTFTVGSGKTSDAATLSSLFALAFCLIALVF